MNEVERLLWWAIRRRQAGCHYRRQVPIGPYVADFACLGHRLVIECDGSQHAEEVDHDEERDAYLAKRGFAVLRFWDSEVVSDLEVVVDTITQHCGDT
jgi:very-short-patch-repair endonuclease